MQLQSISIKATPLFNVARGGGILLSYNTTLSRNRMLKAIHTFCFGELLRKRCDKKCTVQR